MESYQDSVTEIICKNLNIFGYHASDACIAHIVEDVMNFFDEDLELASMYRGLCD